MQTIWYCLLTVLSNALWLHLLVLFNTHAHTHTHTHVVLKSACQTTIICHFWMPPVSLWQRGGQTVSVLQLVFGPMLYLRGVLFCGWPSWPLLASVGLCWPVWSNGRKGRRLKLIFVPIFQIFIFNHFHARWHRVSVTCSVTLKDRRQLVRDVFWYVTLCGMSKLQDLIFNRQ